MFSLSDLIQFSMYIYIYIYTYFKRIYYKISIWQQKLLLLKMNIFVQFYLQKYFDLFLFKKSDLYKLIGKRLILKIYIKKQKIK